MPETIVPVKKINYLSLFLYPISDEDEVIPSSQVPQNQKQLSIMRNALRNLPTTAEGKYIPSFVSKKKDISVNNTVNCGKKIEAKLQKKKPRMHSKILSSGHLFKNLSVINLQIS